MARESLLQVDCSNYSDRIIDVIDLFCEIGWKYYNGNNCVEFTSVGDEDDFDWQSEELSHEELEKIVDAKQSSNELVH